VESPEAARIEIEAEISDREKEAQRLRDALARVEDDLRVLYRAREILTGQTDTRVAARRSSKGRASIPNLVEQVLREYGEMHADEIADKLRSYSISKQSITSAVSRYIDKGKRFRRTGKNKFALLRQEVG
jgi:hypothetical protein